LSADVGSVLIESHVSDVVELVLNVPVLTDEAEELLGTGFLRRQACEHVACLDSGFAFASHLGPDSSHLGQPGPLDGRERFGGDVDDSLLFPISMTVR
jgi:hypothetical protein